MKKSVERIPAGEFKTKCLQLMDEVQKLRKQIVITKRGKPVAMLVPCNEEPFSLFGCMKGSVRSYGNIIDPIEDEWESNA
ncbi:MAG TPA: type II toxin-antitoxin system Phd/YefM family antitoxin [Candidatus Obscuribacterales bacterium]